jgi:hypothetical protein
MLASIFILLASASQVPAIDIHSSCRGTETAALPEERAVAYRRCVRDERTAQEKLSEIWGQIPIDSRQLCTDLSTGFSPSYSQLLTCLEIRARVDLLHASPPT